LTYTHADGAFQVAVVGDLDDRQAGMLLVVGTEAAVLRAALADRRGEAVRDGTSLEVGQRFQEPVGVAGDEGLAAAVARTLLAQVDLAVAEDAGAVHQLAAGRTDALAEGVEDLVRRGVGGEGEVRVDDREVHGDPRQAGVSTAAER
jgi:hypothetical protein